MFRPILCPDPSSSSLFLVALPIPLAKVWTGAILGASGAHIQCLRKLNGLHGTTDLSGQHQSNRRGHAVAFCEGER